MTDIDAIYGISVKLIRGRESWFPKIEAHEQNDSEGSDLLWVAVNRDDEVCEGEVIKLSPLGSGRWYAAHDYANNFGGWPTVWDSSGSEGEVLQALISYLEAELPKVQGRRSFGQRKG